MCPQKDIFTHELIPGCEDCLLLNVYTPNITPEKLQAVMVFIHGGGFKSGSGNTFHYGPGYLMEHGVVVITINYRLEALGFLCLHNKDVPGNAGLKDQNLALKWVKENIKKFGGDPDNVTIFGESAGGASVVYHVLSPMSKGLFKRAIVMSGVPACDWAQWFAPDRRGFALGKELGFETDDSKKLLDHLQSVHSNELIDTSPCVQLSEEILQRNLLKMYHFPAVVEKNVSCDNFLTETPYEILKHGKINDVDLMVGHTSHETLIVLPFFLKYIPEYNTYPEMFVPSKILIESTPGKILHLSDRIKKYYYGNKAVSLENMKEFVKYSSECTFDVPINRFLQLLPKTNKSRYYYRFSSVSDLNLYGNLGLKYNLTGAAHLDDLMYLFTTEHANVPITKNSKEYEMIQLATKLFTNFAKYG